MKQCPNGKYSPPTCYQLMIQLITRLRTLHGMGFVHNDIKLENIVIGQEDSHQLYLIDFGLASRYHDKSGDHITKVKLRQFSGNFLFASMNQCRGNNTSPRDDIEAAILILIYLLNDSKLPWSNFGERYRSQKLSFCEYLKKRIKKKNVRKLFDMAPDGLK